MGKERQYQDNFGDFQAENSVISYSKEQMLTEYDDAGGGSNAHKCEECVGIPW